MLRIESYLIGREFCGLNYDRHGEVSLEGIAAHADAQDSVFSGELRMASANGSYPNIANK
jgi:hypothetical protein